MPTFNMDDLIKEAGEVETVIKPLHQKIGRGGKRAMGEKAFQEHRSRQDTETLIKNYIGQVGEPVSIIAIARQLDRTASPHFRSIVLDMTRAGELVESVDVAPNGRMIRYLYSLPQSK